MPRNPQSLHAVSDAGNTYRFVKLLGAGAQGDVYDAVDGNDRHHAIKVYHASTTGMGTQRRILELLVKRDMRSNAARRRFVWPLELVDVSDGRWGYVMERVERSHFLDLGEIQSRRKGEMRYAAMCEASCQLAESFRVLHLEGFSYRDISRNNILFDPATGEIRIIDNDNVGPSDTTEAAVAGTLDYMAPELILGKEKPNSCTDLHSLAVLLFEIWTWHHPFHGDLEYRIHCLDFPAKRELYGENPVFIFDPENAANRPNAPEYQHVKKRWNVLPDGMKNLFIRAFGEGLKNPSARVTEWEWVQQFSQMAELLQDCACGAENFLELGTDVTCWHCRKRVLRPPLLAIRTAMGPRYLRLHSGMCLHPHHLEPRQERNPSVLVGCLVQNPANPGQWGLKNCTQEHWILTRPDGTSVGVPPQKSASVLAGAKITIGNVELSFVN